jgi:hypothetical protein
VFDERPTSMSSKLGGKSIFLLYLKNPKLYDTKL